MEEADSMFECCDIEIKDEPLDAMFDPTVNEPDESEDTPLIFEEVDLSHCSTYEEGENHTGDNSYQDPLSSDPLALNNTVGIKIQTIAQVCGRIKEEPQDEDSNECLDSEAATEEMNYDLSENTIDDSQSMMSLGNLNQDPLSDPVPPLILRSVLKQNWNEIARNINYKNNPPTFGNSSLSKNSNEANGFSEVSKEISDTLGLSDTSQVQNIKRQVCGQLKKERPDVEDAPFLDDTTSRKHVHLDSIAEQFAPLSSNKPHEVFGSPVPKTNTIIPLQGKDQLTKQVKAPSSVSKQSGPLNFSDIAISNDSILNIFANNPILKQDLPVQNKTGSAFLIFNGSNNFNSSYVVLNKLPPGNAQLPIPQPSSSAVNLKILDHEVLKTNLPNETKTLASIIQKHVANTKNSIFKKIKSQVLPNREESPMSEIKSHVNSNPTPIIKINKTDISNLSTDNPVQNSQSIDLSNLQQYKPHEIILHGTSTPLIKLNKMDLSNLIMNSPVPDSPSIHLSNLQPHKPSETMQHITTPPVLKLTKMDCSNLSMKSIVPDIPSIHLSNLQQHKQSEKMQYKTTPPLLKRTKMNLSNLSTNCPVPDSPSMDLSKLSNLRQYQPSGTKHEPCADLSPLLTSKAIDKTNHTTSETNIQSTADKSKQEGTSTSDKNKQEGTSTSEKSTADTSKQEVTSTSDKPRAKKGIYKFVQKERRKQKLMELTFEVEKKCKSEDEQPKVEEKCRKSRKQKIEPTRQMEDESCSSIYVSCTECKKIYLHEKSYMNHRALFYKRYQSCIICEEVCINMCELQTHHLYHSVEEGKTFCALQHTDFQTSVSMVVQFIQLFNNTKPGYFACMCGRSYTTRQKLIEHVKARFSDCKLYGKHGLHSLDLKYKLACGKTVPPRRRVPGLTTRPQKVVLPVSMKCIVCDLEISNRYDYLEHVRFAHQETYYCDMCPFQVTTSFKKDIHNHIMKHIKLFAAQAMTEPIEL